MKNEQVKQLSLIVKSAPHPFRRNIPCTITDQELSKWIPMA